MLDYEPDMTSFTKVIVESGAAVAIDDDGEIWILAGAQNDTFNLNLPAMNKKEPRGRRSIERPIKTNFMRKIGCKAIDI